MLCRSSRFGFSVNHSCAALSVQNRMLHFQNVRPWMRVWISGSATQVTFGRARHPVEPFGVPKAQGKRLSATQT